MTVDPQTRALIDLMASFGLPRPETMKAPDVRELFAAGRDTRPAGPKLARVEDVTVGGAPGELAARLYAKSAKAPLPAIIYFHGGGWVLGDVDGDDPACRQLAASSGAMVISVDYRHARAPLPRRHRRLLRGDGVARRTCRGSVPIRPA
ncbi:MAG: alpha/beta hydrolase [Acidimicrobiales bacterium]